jgi:hypothetical protein
MRAHAEPDSPFAPALRDDDGRRLLTFAQGLRADTRSTTAGEFNASTNADGLMDVDRDKRDGS